MQQFWLQPAGNGFACSPETGWSGACGRNAFEQFPLVNPVLNAVTGKIKLALAAGKANPAPPVGPALGSKVRSALWRKRTCGQAPLCSGKLPRCLGGRDCRAALVVLSIDLDATWLQGVNIMAFCKEYNAQTAKMIGDIIPVEITVYEVRPVLPMTAPGVLCACTRCPDTCARDSTPCAARGGVRAGHRRPPVPHR